MTPCEAEGDETKLAVPAGSRDGEGGERRKEERSKLMGVSVSEARLPIGSSLDQSAVTIHRDTPESPQ